MSKFSKQPLVSIIVPAYNAASYLSDCLASLERQSMTDIEVIVVDDGSYDETAEIAESFASHDDRFAVRKKENGGVSSARNQGLALAKGRYVMFVDSDDWIEDDAVERLVSIAEAREADVVLTAYCEHVYPTDKRVFVRLAEPEGRSFPDLIADDSTQYGGFVWNKLLRRDKLTVPYREDLSYYENLVFLLENFDEQTRFDVVYAPLYHYRVHKESAVHRMRFHVRQVSTLEALRIALDLVPGTLVTFYKYLFLNRMCRIECMARNDGVSVDLSAEKDFSRHFVSEIVRSDDVSARLKLKTLVIRYLPALYRVRLLMQSAL